MPRIARAIAIGVPHHVTQRGNHGNDVFFSAEDRKHYLCSMRNFSAKYSLHIWAYCLMSNHVHFIVTPTTDTSMARTFQTSHMLHTQKINREHEWTGHLWQGRFFSCTMDEYHFWTAIRYVEQNPVRAGLVERAEDYLWSSAAAHCGLRSDPLITPSTDLFISTCPIDDWRAWLCREDQIENDLIRSRTSKGVPCGNEEFVTKISAITGVTFQTNPNHRRRKKR